MEDWRRPEHDHAPPGNEDARVDEKGRLKLPSQFLEYLKQLKDERVFITTFNPNKKLTVVYPMSEWRRLENFLDAQGRSSPEAAREVRDVRRVAKHFGADSTVDGQGRVLVPALLRKEFQLENQKVWMSFELGRFNVWTDEAYQSDLSESLGRIDSSSAGLEGTGRI